MADLAEPAITDLAKAEPQEGAVFQQIELEEGGKDYLMASNSKETVEQAPASPGLRAAPRAEADQEHQSN